MGKRIRLCSSVLLGASVVLGATLPRSGHLRAATLTPVTQMMNFFPEPEEGGNYAAQALGIYKKYGLDSSIAAFPVNAINAISPVAAGKVQFGMAGADEVLTARQQGIPIVTLFAVYQDTEFGLMWHAEDTSIKSIADLSGHKVIYLLGSPYWNYLAKKYKYHDIKGINYDFTLRLFLNDKTAVNQCSIAAEPYTALQAGQKVIAKSLASTGFNPYGNVMFTTEDMIKNHPDVVRSYVKATLEGWNTYLKNPRPVNAYMQKQEGMKNAPMSMAAMDYDVRVSRPLITGGDAARGGIGAMSAARWATLYKQLAGVGIKLDKAKATDAYALQFLH